MENKLRTSYGTYECCAAWHYERKWWNRELTQKCKLKCYMKAMKDPLGVCPSKGNRGTTRGKGKILLTSMGIELRTSYPLNQILRTEVHSKLLKHSYSKHGKRIHSALLHSNLFTLFVPKCGFMEKQTSVRRAGLALRYRK